MSPPVKIPKIFLKICSCCYYKPRAMLLRMLIDERRFHFAARRLALRELRRRVDQKRIVLQQDIMHDAEFDALLNRAFLPRAQVKLAFRLWKRGHIIIDFSTREVARHPNDVAAMR